MRTFQAVFTQMRTFVIVPKNKGIVMSKLYESILSLCTEAGIKGGKMCVDVGLSKSFMTDLKTGRRNGMSASTAQKIADYFGVSVDRVMSGEKKSLYSETEGISPAKRELLSSIDDLTDDQCIKLLGIIAEAKKLL